MQLQSHETIIYWRAQIKTWKKGFRLPILIRSMLDIVFNLVRFPNDRGELRDTERRLWSISNAGYRCNWPKTNFCPLNEETRWFEFHTYLSGFGNRLLIFSLSFQNFQTLALVIPVSTVQCKRGFSAQNRILNSKRSRLTKEHSEDLMILLRDLTLNILTTDKQSKSSPVLQAQI